MSTVTTIPGVVALGANQRAARADCRGKRIGILVVTYNAVTTLARVLKRIPAEVWENVEEVLVFDDASQDSTYELAVGLKMVSGAAKLQVLRQPKNLGYGGNQKAGYFYFLSRGFDVVVLLHGDGQYAPEALADMYHQIVTGEADAVFGSRMMPDYGGPLKGGMPLYKYAGNRTLTWFENRAVGLNLTEWHSGYRAYSLKALGEIDVSEMTDEFHFDTEIIIKLHHQGFRIREVPIPTFYGNEICYVNGLRYAKDILRAVYRYRQTRASVRSYPEYQEYFVKYRIKTSPWSGHWLAREAVGTKQRVLEITSGATAFGVELERAGNQVVSAGPAFVRAAAKRTRFTRIVMLDVLEHLADPERVLREAAEVLEPRGRIVVSLPNVANLSVRVGLLFGRFRYGDRGILDRGHLRFYTRRTARELVGREGFRIVESKMTVIPVEMLIASPKWVVRLAHTVLGCITRLLPALLGYETFLIAERR